MWNTTKMIASNQFLPEAELTAFAIANEDKYGVDIDKNGVPWISNWYVDSLMKDFRALNTELCEHVRDEKIAELRARNAA